MISTTKQIILDRIKREGALMLDEAVTLTGFAKTTLREHFLHLENEDLIKKTYLRDGPGRPKLQYELAPAGEALYPSYEGTMLSEWITYLKKNGGEELMESLFKHFWDKRIDKADFLKKTKGSEESENNLDYLKEMLEEEGFMPEFSKRGDRLAIKECNCPFSKIVEQTQLPCKLELEFYRKIIGKKVERITHILDGENACTYLVEE